LAFATKWPLNVYDPLSGGQLTSKRNVLPFITTWIALEDIMLTKMSEKNKYCVNLYWLSRAVEEDGKLTEKIVF